MNANRHYTFYVANVTILLRENCTSTHIVRNIDLLHVNPLGSRMF